jgi:hypothetical protein
MRIKTHEQAMKKELKKLALKHKLEVNQRKSQSVQRSTLSGSNKIKTHRTSVDNVCRSRQRYFNFHNFNNYR